ncbi:hypothetical protein [Jatrophihabitans endophyticus]|uniref:hypothetical protein n=1 Tax=Jatrophihabitans endophyticus TaxID=1206085 RepID=UPI0019FD0BF5|nr:hypothetical protein [Jatrophihabitans endophyticus]MBE7190810.1 hypothetical protein [Jatrophihabitans endophyticus]
MPYIHKQCGAEATIVKEPQPGLSSGHYFCANPACLTSGQVQSGHPGNDGGDRNFPWRD